MDFFFVAVTWLGSLYLLLPLTVLLCLLLLWYGKSGQAISISLGMVITIISVHAAKLLFRRPRPSSPDLLVAMPADWSFPSAHTAQAAAFFLSVTLIAFQVLPTLWATLVALLSLLVIGLVGYSRIYLQVHYLSDVLAGMALAVLIVSGVRLLVPLLPWLQGK
ncbi:MAG: phosphatase PAP2 family protein [Desulforhopalus sp.]|nr:phosphatase PAP2 family protein [Desulforhopalus sp.]